MKVTSDRSKESQDMGQRRTPDDKVKVLDPIMPEGRFSLLFLCFAFFER
jgi:hypothetical protein